MGLCHERDAGINRKNSDEADENWVTGLEPGTEIATNLIFPGEENGEFEKTCEEQTSHAPNHIPEGTSSVVIKHLETSSAKDREELG